MSGLDETANDLARAARILREGGLVAFPTETVYGLGAHALDASAVRKIFAAKGRPATNPLIVHVDSIDAARALTHEFPPMAMRLAERFWPGPLTLVLPRAGDVPDEVTAGGPTVGVRVPAHPLALALLRAAALPIAAPSANRSLAVSPTTAAHVRASLGAEVDLILDGGPCSGGLESTVLALGDGQPRLLRPGLIQVEALEDLIGPIARGPEPSAAIAASPGLGRRHYSPRASMGWWDGGALRPDEGALLFDDVAGEVLVMPRDPAAYATQLYAALHALDARGVARIVVARVPDDPRWAAILDRLERAMRPE